jgi:site-specific recombinase XerD
MQELMQIHFSFLCRKGRANKKGESPIILRAIFRQERRDIYTGLYCPYTYWNPGEGKVKSDFKKAGTINKNMGLINYKALQVFDQLRFSSIPFTIDDPVAKIKGQEEKPTQLIEYLQIRNEELKLKVGSEITDTTYEKYERSLRFMIEFLKNEFKIKNFLLAKIDKQYLEKYLYYLRNGRKIGNNTAVKYMGSLKTVLMPAIQEGIIPHDPFRGIKFKAKTVYKGFLTGEEIDLLSALKTKSSDLERIKDQYLFCCYTGLAYIDLRQLGREHFIKQKEDEYYIIKQRQKTGQQSIIPLLPSALRILQKYSPTPDFRDFRWQVSSNQKMNQRLKTIGELAGIARILHMHLARHTFATTITLSNGVPMESVSSMLGHATLRQTQHYAKIVALKVINDMAKLKEMYK